MAQTDALRPYQPAAPTQLGEDRRYLRNELDKLSASISSVRAVMQELEATLNTDTANIATNTTGIAANTTSIASNTSALAKITGNPALDVVLTVAQTATASVWNQVEFNVVSADVYSGWNSSTHRYTPPAGVYLFIGTGYFLVGAGADSGVSLVSNGSTHEQLGSFQINASASDQQVISQVSVVLAGNGSKTFELQCLVSGAVPQIYSGWTRLQVIRLA